MPVDPQTLVPATALVLSIVGVTKFLIPTGTHQNDFVRLYAALVGVAIYALAVLADPSAHLTLQNAAQVLLPAAAQGFTDGAGSAVLAKAYHLGQDFVATKEAPAAPASSTPATTA